MAKLQATELRSKSIIELNALLLELQRDLFNFRMKKNTGQLQQSHLFTGVKKDIARVKTIIGEQAGS